MKTAKDIQLWFNAECKSALKEIPEEIRERAKKDRGLVILIAESIAMKKCFNKKEVLKYLDSLI